MRGMVTGWEELEAHAAHGAPAKARPAQSLSAKK
jgi:hypothetical protein